MKVTLYVASYKREPVFIARRGCELRLGFGAEVGIDLPFAPFPGLAIEYPGPGPEADPYRLTVNSVVWEHAEQRFFCSCKDDFSYGDSRDMEDAAADYESAGFRVNRGDMCQGEW